MKKKIIFIVCLVLIFCFHLSYAKEMEIRVILSPDSSPAGSPMPGTGEMSVVFTKIFPLFHEKYPDVKLIGEEIIGDTEAKNKYLLECKSGNPPDILQIDGFWAAEFAEAGALVPLDKLLPKALIDDYFDAFKLNYKDHLVALVPTTAFNSMLWYRKDLFEEAGLETPPSDWNELKAYAEKLTTPEHYGLALCGGRSELTSVELLGLYWQGIDEFITQDNIPVYNNQLSIDIFSLFQDLYKNKCIPPETINMGYDEVLRIFCAKKAAMMFYGSWISNLKQLNNLAPSLKGKIGLAPNPVYPKTGNRGANAGGWALAITTDDPEKYEVCAYLLGLLAGSDKELYKEQVLQGNALPTLRSVLVDPVFTKTEFDKIIMDELQYTNTRPVVELYPDASLEWAQAFQETLLGSDPAEALERAVIRTIEIGKEKGLIPEDYTE